MTPKQTLQLQQLRDAERDAALRDADIKRATVGLSPREAMRVWVVAYALAGDFDRLAAEEKRMAGRQEKRHGR